MKKNPIIMQVGDIMQVGGLEGGLGRTILQFPIPVVIGHFEEPEEYQDIAQIRPIGECQGTILGQLTQDGSHCLDFNPVGGRINGNMMVLYEPDSGKSYRFVKNKIFQLVKQRKSAIVSDPDGGLYRSMAKFLIKRGYTVRHLNFSNPARSDGWDCLKSLDGENVEINAAIFAHNVVANMKTDGESALCIAGAETLLTALILRVLLGPDYPAEKKNILSVYQLLQDKDGIEHLEFVFDPLRMPAETKPCLAPYLTVKQASKNLVSYTMAFLATGLSALQSSAMSGMLSMDNIDLTLPGQVPCVFFCQFPVCHQPLEPLTSAFFLTAFIALANYADSTSAGMLPVPVEFVLDEFPSIGVFPDWHRELATARKRGMSVTMLCQSDSQLRKRYPDSSSMIIANCGTVVSLGVPANWVEVHVKKDSIELTNTQSLGEDEMLIFFQRHDPIRAFLVPYVLHPYAEELEVPPPPK